MEDARIVELYWERDEAAIAESSAKYGGYCYQIAFRILALREDAEECVGDTWLRAWEAMPPSRPGRLDTVSYTHLDVYKRQGVLLDSVVGLGDGGDDLRDVEDDLRAVPLHDFHGTLRLSCRINLNCNISSKHCYHTTLDMG